jgi:hypothetical protein
MSSIIERLTEGVVNRDMRAEGNALLNKWQKTGLLEGLDNDRKRQSMARLLENQAKELLRESSSMSAGDVEGFAAVAFPIVRRVFAGLIANDLVSVQPMSLPSGLIFFLDFVFSPDLGASDSADLPGVGPGRMGNLANESIYGTNRVGAQVTGGVSLIGDLKEDLSGPRTVGARGYAYASPTGSSSVNCTSTQVTAFGLTGASPAQKKSILWDADLMAISASGDGLAAGGGAYWVVRVDIPQSALTLAGADDTDGTVSQLDYDNLGTISGGIGSLNNISSGHATAFSPANTAQLRRLTHYTGSSTNNIQLYFLTTSEASGISTQSTSGIKFSASYAIRDNLAASNALGSVVGTTLWGLEASEQIPEIDIKVDSIAVTAVTKKLKAKWTPELGQDLNAYHNLDAEVELTSILSEQVALEIDREILADLVNGAQAATYYWSRSPGLFVNRSTGTEIGASSAAPDFTGTVSEWYETLVETVNDVSAQIHRKTLRGGANFLVCGPEVANILEFTAGFRASVTHDDETGSVGAVKVGALSKKFDVIVDPYFLRNVILVGRRGSSFLESGYVYAPYVPLQTTPTIFGPEDFVPRKGVMTRYAKKMVRPDMYGLVVVRGLVGEAGNTA